MYAWKLVRGGGPLDAGMTHRLGRVFHEGVLNGRSERMHQTGRSLVDRDDLPLKIS